MHLYLDGVRFFQKTLASYETPNSSWIKKEVWSRLTMPLQTMLHMVEAVVMQILRGIASLASGIFTFEGKKIQVGIADVISAIAQVVVIPVLGIIAVFYPKFARHMAEKMPQHQYEDHTSSTCGNLRLEITGIIRGIIAAPIGVIDGITLGISGILSGNVSRISQSVHHFALGLISPLFGFLVGCDGWAEEVVWKVHWIKVKAI